MFYVSYFSLKYNPINDSDVNYPSTKPINLNFEAKSIPIQHKTTCTI